MTRATFRLLVIGCFIIPLLAFAGSALAQGRGGGKGKKDPPPPPPPWQYSVEYVGIGDFPQGFPDGTDSFRINEVAYVNHENTTMPVVAGWYFLNDVKRGFVYDHRNNQFTDIPTLLGLGNQWESSSCVGLNENGIVVGYVNDFDGNRYGMWFDLNDPQLNLLDVQYGYASRVNNVGDIILVNGYVVNPFTEEFIDLGSFEPRAINDFRVIVGNQNGTLARWDLVTENSQEFPETNSVAVGGINNFDEFCGPLNVYGKNPNKYKRYAYRYGDGFEWTSELEVITATSINDSGDVAGKAGNRDGYFYHSDIDQTFLLTSLTDDAYFNLSTQSFVHISERVDVSTDVPRAPVISGKTFGPEDDDRIFFMFPGPPPEN